MSEYIMFYRAAIMYVMVVLMAACATFGLTAPQTFNQRLAYSYGSVTSIRLVAKELLDKHKISVAEAKDTQSKADDARQLLDTARTIKASGDVSTAEGKLAAAQNVLIVLQEFLKAKGGNL